jgi:hypothetical protein
MGGDDLDDAEDLFWIKPVRESGNDSDSSASDDQPLTKKRVLPQDFSYPSNEVDANKKVKREPSSSKQQLLWKAGCNLDQQSNVEQAHFLTTALRHYVLLQSSLTTKTVGGEEEATEEASLISVLPHHCLKIDATSDSGTTEVSSPSPWSNRIRQVASLKTLREWKPIGSPCVVIVCASARRAVSLLKQELAPLKVRTAKLFPKNGSVQEQCQSLMTASFPIAVGTPHRLRLLSSSETKGKPCLQWDHTQLVILDAHCSQKQYTVCTLPDTAAECMRLLHEFIYPKLTRSGKTKKKNTSHQRRCQITFLA